MSAPLTFSHIVIRDRATYDANLGTAVNYTVDSPADAPASLTFGPQFISLASQLKGQVTLGLNRQLNNQPASLAAAKLAKQNMQNLFAIELGNEPECMNRSFVIGNVRYLIAPGSLCQQLTDYCRRR